VPKTQVSQRQFLNHKSPANCTVSDRSVGPRNINLYSGHIAVQLWLWLWPSSQQFALCAIKQYNREMYDIPNIGIR
jgi:hypothetical protein